MNGEWHHSQTAALKDSMVNAGVARRVLHVIPRQREGEDREEGRGGRRG